MNSITLTISHIIVLLMVILTMLWSPLYAKFLIRNWFPKIEPDDPLFEDFVFAADRVGLTLSTVITILSSLGNFIGRLLVRQSVLSTMAIWLNVGTTLFLLSAALFTIFVLPSIPKAEFLRKAKIGLSYKYIGWGTIILVNVWMLITTWLP